MLLIIIALAVAFYFIMQRDNDGTYSKNKALYTLKERYVSGDIDEDTYIKMKKVIDK